MVNAIESYEKARKGLAQMFGLDDLWYNVISCDTVPWCDYGDTYGSVGYGCEEMSYGFDAEYSFDVYGTSRWVSKCDEYTLFVGENGSGECHMYLLKNCNQVNE